MLINVGMLVHHKINLQNSVDLAAYYGAMKQAESLNAIAHINYQIHQAWKLLNYRYHVIGTMGYDEHPANPNNSGASVQDEISNNPADILCMSFDDIYCSNANFQVANQLECNTPAGGNNTNICRSTIHFGIKSMKVPEVIGFGGWDSDVASKMKKAVETSVEMFKNQGVINFQLVNLFIAMFRADSRNRRSIITEIANQLSLSTDDFLDLNGVDRVKTGVQKTLDYNLTEQNRKFRNFKFFNSMGDPNCKTPSRTNGPPKWLNEIVVVPQFFYFDAKIDGDPANQVGFDGTPVVASKRPSMLESTGLSQENIDRVKKLNELSTINRDMLTNDPQDFQDVIGVEKNPWCLTYVGVSATATPTLPFMPSSLIKIPLKAVGFAKPFGGKVGPWYFSQWSRGSNSSDGTVKVDNLLPPKRDSYISMASLPEQTDKLLGNFSRFPGDTSGMRSDLVKKNYGLVIRTAQAGNPTYNLFEAYFNHKLFDIVNGGNIFSNNLFMPPTLDMLADPYSPMGKKLREIELLGIVPDLFDITYYSIEPNFTSLYLPVLKSNPKIKNLFPRGDLGSRYQSSSVQSPDDTIGEFNIIRQFSTVYDVPGGGGGGIYAANLSSPDGLFFKVYKRNPNATDDPVWGRMLTDWSEVSLLEYSLDNPDMDNFFGKCKEPVTANLQLPGENPTQGECVKGGRTGHSVKIISRQFLESNLQLGGENSGTGSIINPPPSDFYP